MQVYWGFGEFGCRLYRATFELEEFRATPSAPRKKRTRKKMKTVVIRKDAPQTISTSWSSSTRWRPCPPAAITTRTRESPAAGRRNWDITGLMPPARHGAGHHERRHLAPRARHLLHLQDREVPQQPGQHQHLGFSPLRSRDIQPGPACVVLFPLCTQRAATRKTCFGSRRKCKLKHRKNLSVPTQALQGRTPT